ncbi:MAG: hypothetical protein NTW12_15545 [Deltaproteobacteria bacterium]|nr:hypothetical protein [Deltaproteobacteria bacterium]
MKKVIILVSLILLLLAGINSYSQEPSPPAIKGQVQPRKFNSKSNANSNINTNDNNNSAPKTVFPINKINTQRSNSETQKANKENGNSQEGAVKNDPIIRYTFWLMIFTGALVICNVGLWLYTRKSANSAKKAADALPTIERAYLFIDSIEWPKGELGFTLSGYNNLNLIKGMIKNVGRTPAILCNVSAKVSIKKSEYPTREVVRGKSEIVFPKGVIITSDGTENFSCGEVIGPSIMTESDFIQATILCYGYVIYEDIFGKSHETGFCYEFKPIYLEGRFHISNNKDLNYYT